MNRAFFLTIVTTAILAARLPAEAPLFQWAPKQELKYRVTQITVINDVADNKPQETTTRLDLIKHWKVLEADSAGNATLAMTLERLRMETKTAEGVVAFFDSADKDKSTPALRDEMMKYVGPNVVVVKLNNRGQIVEVKECKFGSPSRLEADLPFKIVLPGTELVAGQGWERKFAVRVEPADPKETAATFDGVENLTCKSVNGSTAIIAVKNTVTNPPESPADQIPLLPVQTSGEVTFDTKAGRVVAVKYNCSREIAKHKGEESKYQFTSTYVEELVK